MIGVGVLFAAVLTRCVAGRLFGDIKLIDPTILYEDYLECSRREFQKSMIYYARPSLQPQRERDLPKVVVGKVSRDSTQR